MARFTSFIPELWGGIECSFNRVRDQYMDQVEFSGHYNRGVHDIERFASLGISAIRYPLTWERYQPSLKQQIDWRCITEQLHALEARGIRPIAGLIHHGNGPSFTSLMDPSFADYFKAYAQQVARRFPWLEYYTPINEPLTTARFSGLYGLWYPHHKNDRSFALILLNQMKATVLAMKAIRDVNPEVKLLQTEDLGKTYSTELLQYQADFENERRWLTYDILCGKFNSQHPLWDYFQWLNVPETLFYFFLDNPCPPDIIGADHYLTSERYLDEKLELYPIQKHGGNGRHRYADVEAIRVSHAQPWGLKTLLQETWQRYQIPIAVTEVHINGTSADQIRWFKDVWDTCLQLNKTGCNIQAVTSWSLLGSYGWNNLLTAPHGHYEAGAFDMVNGEPVATELAVFLNHLSKDPHCGHPALAERGWWQDEKTRCLYNVNPACKQINFVTR